MHHPLFTMTLLTRLHRSDNLLYISLTGVSLWPGTGAKTTPPSVSQAAAAAAAKAAASHAGSLPPSRATSFHASGAASATAKSVASGSQQHQQQRHPPHSSHSHLTPIDSGGPRTLDKAWSRARRTPTYTTPPASLLLHQSGLQAGQAASGSHLQTHKEDQPQQVSSFALHQDNLRQLYPELSGTSHQLGMGEAPLGSTSPCPQPTSPSAPEHQGPRLLCRAPSMARSGVVGRRSTGIHLHPRKWTSARCTRTIVSSIECRARAEQ
jgi:hypothetical protein